MTTHDISPSRTPSGITAAHVLEATPESYRPYVIAAHALSDTEAVAMPYLSNRSSRVSARGAWQAIKALSDANTTGTLNPPLPEGMAAIINDMSDRADAVEQELLHQNYAAGMCRINAIGTYDNWDYREAAVLAVRSALAHAGLTLG